MKTRIISGVIMAAGGVAALLAGGYIAGVVVLLIALGAYFELCRACNVIEKGKMISIASVFGYIAITVYYVNLMFGPQQNAGMINGVILLVVMLAQLAVYVFTFPKYKVDQIAASIFSLMYAPWMLSFLYVIMVSFEKGKYIIFLCFVASSISDACAYFVGVSLGKHKLAPVLSPKKSIEGAVGGLLGATIIGLIYGLILYNTGVFPESEVIWSFALIGFIGSIVSQIGDLAASAIKRDHDIKDYSKLIPGHGGIMDRMDSICVTVPIIYYLACLFLK